ncbi:hypothetical protein jhhlp_008490 [Lomentospora prolificans]|uniref:Zn(2)-C6 fungal-type domain-containing protein n=1 Tax=Lomentospora prolificans TaxID=41688 RepID=A0A2N3MY68_9PEZI|nr:hypothetical protein jhhlp_008490 [Lomentospora prolificans]
MSSNAKRPAASNTSGETSMQNKRRRVSRACDTCRSAKDKCDGVKPRCQRCVSMQRQCTYLNPEKRRGIRTGYLRAIEVALALLLDYIPASESVLLMALSEQEDDQRDIFIDKDSPTAEALLKRWHQSDVYQGIDRIISRDETTPRSDPPDGDGASSVPRLLDSVGRRAERNGELTKWRAGSLRVMSPASQHGFGEVSHLELPSNSRNYLEAYFTWAHCWFPIVEQEPLTQLAASYPATGFRVDPRDQSYSRHAELWSAMAVGAALESRRGNLPDVLSRGPGRIQIPGEPPSHVVIYSTARKLVPTEDGVLDECHVRSLLLLSLAKLASSETNASWMLIGQAVRLFLQLPKYHTGQKNPFSQQDLIVFMACFILDTLVSLRLGKPSQMRSLDLPDTLHPLDAQFRELSNPPDCSNNPSMAPSPMAALFQQYKFARILSQNLSMRTGGGNPSSAGFGPAELVQSLDPPFHFCNALVHGGLTPKAPAAFLVHAGFLTTSILLAPASMPRLIESLLDVVGHCVSAVGANTSPLLLSLYLELAVGEGRLDCLKPDERSRTVELLQTLKGGSDNQEATCGPQSVAAGSIGLTPQSAMEGLTPENPSSVPLFGGEGVGMRNNVHSRGALDNSSGFTTTTAPNILHSNSCAAPGNSVPINPLLGNGMGNENHGMMNLGRMGGYPVDYDAILDELSSLDYVDNIEPDPQFMTNLGFAPGSELNEMFNGHFGSM